MGDKAYLNAKPDIGIFGQALNWGGGKGGDDLSARAKKNGLTNDQQMWRDSGALSAAKSRRRRSSSASSRARALQVLCVCVRPPARAVFSSHPSFRASNLSI